MWAYMPLANNSRLCVGLRQQAIVFPVFGGGDAIFREISDLWRGLRHYCLNSRLLARATPNVLILVVCGVGNLRHKWTRNSLIGAANNIPCDNYHAGSLLSEYQKAKEKSNTINRKYNSCLASPSPQSRKNKEFGVAPATATKNQRIWRRPRHKLKSKNR